MILGTTALCALLLAGSVTVVGAIVDEMTIRTSTGTFKLSPSDPSKLVDESALRSARRTAELAMSALSADVEQLEGKQKALTGDVKGFNNRADLLKADLDSQEKALDAEFAVFDSKLNLFVKDMKSYNAEVADQRAQVEASNSLRPDQRNAANISRLNTWGDKLDVQKAALESRKQTLDREGAAFDNKAAKFEASRKTQVADLKLAYENLRKRDDELSIKLGEAYEQLEYCYGYAQKIDTLLSDKYNVSVSTTPTGVMKDVGERLKEMSNRGFDGSTEKAPLTDSNKGPQTPFFGKP
jgi:chromosome segregation ATPase